jgi:hypothetical protein
MEDHIIHSDQNDYYLSAAFRTGDGGACRDAPAIKSVKKGVSGTTRGHKQNPDWVRRIEPKEISRLSTYQR